MTEPTPHRYRVDGVRRGVDPDVVDRAQHRRSLMQAGGLVPILSLGHLGHLTGASYRYLRDIVERTRDPYLDIARPKKFGGTRAISSPEPVLMDVQRWLLRNVFNRVEQPPSSHAYCRNRSVLVQDIGT